MSKFLRTKEDFCSLKKDSEVAVTFSIQLKNSPNPSIVHGKVEWNNKEGEEVDINTGSEDVLIKYGQIKFIELFN